MRRVLIPQLPAPGRPAELPPEEAHHVLSVLRLKSGDELEALDGSGGAARGRLVVTGKKSAQVEYTGPVEGPRIETLPLCLELALLKADAMEWVIEKAVELGAARVVPVLAEHCVVKKEGPVERWQRLADQALKQCGRPRRLLVEPVARVRELPNGPGRLICDEAARGENPGLLPALRRAAPATSELRLLIGPEGGWAKDELARVAGERVSLGAQVLRAETAALFALSVAGAALRWPEALAESPGKS